MGERDDSRPAPTLANTVAAPAPEPIPETGIDLVSLGYEILEEIGHGGVGRVVRALDRRLGREVALKLPLEASDAAVISMMREARVTARLPHPSIVPIYEAGRLPNGRPFYTMKLVDGKTLRDLVEECGTLRERLALLPKVIAIADAIAFAHARRTIHRDLKPSNVLIGSFGETIVLDWGLAQDLDEPHATVHISGTPSWMAPEQATGAPCDERTDVFALGLILAFLLSGQTPYGGESHDAILLAAALADLPPLPPDSPEDLVAIVRRATRRFPSERYADGTAFASDLHRYVTGQLVSSRQYSLAELLRRWMRKYRAPLTVAGAAAAALAVVGTVSLQGIRRARSDAEAHRDRLLLSQAESALERDPTEAVAWLKARAATGALAASDSVRAGEIASEAESSGVSRMVVDGIVDATLDPRGQIAVTIDRACRVEIHDVSTAARRMIGQGSAPCGPIVFSAGGSRIAARFARGIGIWDREGRTLVAPPAEGAEIGEGTLRWAPDESGLAGTSGADILYWRAADGASRVLCAGGDRAIAAEFSPDGREVASLHGDRGRILLSSVDGHSQGNLLANNVTSLRVLRYTTDGSGLVAGGADGKVDLWELPPRDGHRTIMEFDSAIVALVVSSTGVVAGAQDGAFEFWSRELDRVKLRGSGPGGVRSLVLSPDAERLYIGGMPRIQVMDFRTNEVEVLKGHEGAVDRLALAADESVMVSVDQGGVMRLWRLGLRPASTFSSLPYSVSGLSFRGDGKQIAAFGQSASLGLCSIERRLCQAWGPWSGSGEIRAMSWLPGRGESVTGYDDGALRIWDEKGAWQGSAFRPGFGAVRALAVARTGSWVAFATDDGTVALWDRARGTHELMRSKAPASSIAFSADERWVAAAGADGVLRIASAHETRPASEFSGHTGAITRVDIDPDSHQAVTSGVDGTVRVWALDGSGSRVFEPRVGPLAAASFFDASTLLVQGERSVAIVDTKTGEVRAMPGRRAIVTAVATSSEAIASGGSDRVVRVWNPRTGAVRAFLLPSGYDYAVTALSFSADGRQLAVGDDGGHVVLWTVSLQEASSPLQERLESLSAARFGEDGVLRDDAVQSLRNSSGSSPALLIQR